MRREALAELLLMGLVVPVAASGCVFVTKSSTADDQRAAAEQKSFAWRIAGQRRLGVLFFPCYTFDRDEFSTLRSDGARRVAATAFSHHLEARAHMAYIYVMDAKAGRPLFAAPIWDDPFSGVPMGSADLALDDEHVAAVVWSGARTLVTVFHLPDGRLCWRKRGEELGVGSFPQVEIRDGIIRLYGQDPPHCPNHRDSHEWASYEVRVDPATGRPISGAQADRPGTATAAAPPRAEGPATPARAPGTRGDVQVRCGDLVIERIGASWLGARRRHADGG